MTRRQLNTLAGFLLIPALSAAAPLLVIPAVAGTHGAGGWTIVALGLAIGNAVAVIADLGWSVTGPQTVARTPEDATRLARVATASRLVVLVALAGPAAIAALSVPSSNASAVLTVAAGAALTALSPAWLLVGQGRPWTLAVVETLPKAAANVAAAVAITAGAPLVVYGAFLGGAALLTLCLAHATGIARLPRWRDLRGAPDVIVQMRVLALGRATSTIGTVLPPVLLAAVAPAVVPVYAAVDRPLRMGLQVLQAVPTRMQSWLGSQTGDHARRVRTTVTLNTALGVVAAAAFVVGGPTVLDALFRGAVEIPVGAVVAGGVLVAAVCSSRGFGLAAVFVGRSSATSATAHVVAVLGAVGVVVGALVGGAPGALLGLAVAECAGLVPPITSLRQWSRLTDVSHNR